jgi:metalloendopeptidase OMA1, mitochondrial
MQSKFASKLAFSFPKMRFRTGAFFSSAAPSFTLYPRQPFVPLHRAFRAYPNLSSRRPYSYGSRYQRFQQTTSLLRRWAARPTFAYEAGGLGVAVGCFYVYNIEVVPVSGRRRFNVVSNETEASFSKQAYQQVMSQYEDRILPMHDRRTQMVDRVLRRLIPASGLTDQNWEVHVIDDPQKNAFVVPGGKVFVFSGILPICKNDDGVAAVLGHEIAHTVAHHMSERMSRNIFIFLGTIVADVVFGSSGELTNILLKLAFFLPNGRQQEVGLCEM